MLYHSHVRNVHGVADLIAEQSKEINNLTLVSLMLMPPTLIASFFGMNIQFGWFIGNSSWTWLIVVALMLASFAIIFWIFKRRNMF